MIHVHRPPVCMHHSISPIQPKSRMSRPVGDHVVQPAPEAMYRVTFFCGSRSSVGDSFVGESSALYRANSKVTLARNLENRESPETFLNHF